MSVTVTVILDDDGNVFADVATDDDAEVSLATALGVLRMGECTLVRADGP